MITVIIHITHSLLWNGCHQVQFSTVIYGTFRQSLVLDFGASSAALIQPMTVHCKPVSDELTRLNKTLVTDNMEYWIFANKKIIPYEPKFVIFSTFLCINCALLLKTTLNLTTAITNTMLWPLYGTTCFSYCILTLIYVSCL